MQLQEHFLGYYEHWACTPLYSFLQTSPLNLMSCIFKDYTQVSVTKLVLANLAKYEYLSGIKVDLHVRATIQC